ncbi:MAG: hypothetical protein ACXABG_16110, partial [Promethearchaeota archaeon]
MLFLSAESWTIGILRLISVIWGFIWGTFFIYKGLKTKTKLLTYWGIATVGISSTVLGTAVDFLTILATGQNINGTLYIILVWPMAGINGLFLFTVLAELIAPKYKWYFLSNVIIATVFYQLSLFLNAPSFVWLEFPAVSGEEIINDTV